ncbi:MULTISPECIES: hypothetical protein [Brevibacterium]|uniref:YobI-like P-loop NTPase domain-containing protein n=1 Tax=Brevibacterium antiquum CNRZ 918 TaxID=1255637 RepID=A0A2H1KXY2_9MICO|nr:MULTISPECIES: hypothetical protein [Brevibacterium]SMY04587.1 hypothetical protein BANT918_03106 [Brevibacterium antiquum CNRZ 918]
MDVVQARIESWGRSASTVSVPELMPLAPVYDPETHAFYVDLVENALTKSHDGVLNIALSGGYGVGKSSILSEVARRHRGEVISISLSTLGFPEDETQPGGPTAQVAAAKTNRVQKEIVKQLLYSRRPAKTPGSRYRRATRLPVALMGLYAALVGVFVTTVFLLTGWGVKVAESLGIEAAMWVISLVISSVTAVTAFPILALFHHQLQLTALGAGGTTIALSPKSATYFDEYLDEIIYFFEMVKSDIVIFEDIDRFNDPHIFDTLRSLNAILNGAEQLNGRRIRFIYAVKDSIFDSHGGRAKPSESLTKAPEQEEEKQAAEEESGAARANRTKFFEVVIPVVPFVTHRSARDLLDDTIGDELKGGISNDLIDLAGKHVADMRLIKNIRNEYAIFKRRVLEASQLDLDENRMLAMMLYKSIHLRDFENIKLGESQIDELYRKSRRLIDVSIASIDTQLREKRRRRRQASIPSDRAEAFGAALVEYVERVLRHAPSVLKLRGVAAWKLGEITIDVEKISGPAFWEDLGTSDEPLKVIVYRNGTSTLQFEFEVADIERVLGTQIDAKNVVEAELKQIDADIANLEAELVSLRGADMTELTKLERFRLADGSDESTFDELVDKHLTSSLARELLRAGYIDRNFTLYTSPFYATRLSEAAANFLMKNVDRNQPDLNFELKEKDVRLLIEERGYSFLSTPAGLNIYVLDYLLSSEEAGARAVVEYLLTIGEQGEQFVLSYFASGMAPEHLVKMLTPRWSKILLFLVTKADVEESRRNTLIDSALRAVAPDVEYVINDAVASELASLYEAFSVFTDKDVTEAEAIAVSSIVKSSGTKIDNLSVLGPPMRRAIVQDGAYNIARDNLLLAIAGAGSNLSLDAIKEANILVYERVFQDIEAYLRAIPETEPTIAHVEAFPRIVRDIAVAAPSRLEAVVNRAADECIVETLEDVEEDVAAPVLARLGRFAPSFDNIMTYLGWSEVVDKSLITFLGDIDMISETTDADEPEKVALALQLVQAEGLKPSKRAALVDSLALGDRLDVEQVPVEEGELYGELLRYRLIADGADTYAALEGTSWETRKAYIVSSSEFENFATPEIVGTDLANLLADQDIDISVKKAITAEAEAYASIANRSGLKMLATCVLGDGGAVSIDTLKRFAEAGVATDTLLALLVPILPDISIAELTELLKEIGGAFAKLAGATGKRPLIQRTDSAEALVARLTELGVVSQATNVGSKMRVNMKRS